MLVRLVQPAKASSPMVQPSPTVTLLSAVVFWNAASPTSQFAPRETLVKLAQPEKAPALMRAFPPIVGTLEIGAPAEPINVIHALSARLNCDALQRAVAAKAGEPFHWIPVDFSRNRNGTLRAGIGHNEGQAVHSSVIGIFTAEIPICKGIANLRLCGADGRGRAGTRRRGAFRGRGAGTRRYGALRG